MCLGFLNLSRYFENILRIAFIFDILWFDFESIYLCKYMFHRIIGVQSEVTDDGNTEG